MKCTTLIVGTLLAMCAVSFAIAMPLPPDLALHALNLSPGDLIGGLMVGQVAAITAEDLKKLEETMAKKASELIEQVKKLQHDEVTKFETLTTKGNEKLTEVTTEAKAATAAVSDLKAALLEVEQKLAKKHGAGGQGAFQSAGGIFVASDGYKNCKFERDRTIEPVAVGNVHHKTAILNAQGQNQPLVTDQRLPFLQPIQRRLTVRDLLMQLRTESNFVQLPQENVFTNNAAVVFGSPDSKENVAKPESAISFTMTNVPIETIAHWVPISRQLLADAPFLQSYIDQRLSYGLKLKEETQFLTGDGTGGNTYGLLPGDTAYNRGVSNDTLLDTLLKGMLQVAISDMSANGMILNPIDWFNIRLLKDTQGRYLIGAPQEGAEPRLWGLDVVSTNSMTVGQFEVGAYNLAAAVIDREDMTVRMSENYDDYFVKNMVVILVEERTNLMIFRSTAIVGGALPAAGT